MEGFVTKRSRGKHRYQNMNWKVRWLKLEGNVLTYYKDQLKRVKKGRVKLSQHSMVLSHPDVGMYTHVILVKLSADAKHDLVFSTDSAEGRLNWMKKLVEAINGSPAVVSDESEGNSDDNEKKTFAFKHSGLDSVLSRLTGKKKKTRKHGAGKDSSFRESTVSAFDSSDSEEEEAEPEIEKVPVSQHPHYLKYFKMLQMGLPVIAAKNKMMLDKIDPTVLDMDPETLIPVNEAIRVYEAAHAPPNFLQGALGGGLKPQVRKKKLFLKAVRQSMLSEGSLWSTAEDDDDVNVDEDEFARFFVQKLDTKGRRGSQLNRVAAKKKEKIACVIDAKRAQNSAIALARIRIPFIELRDKIVSMDDEGLNASQLLSLKEFLPTPEEVQALKKYGMRPSATAATMAEAAAIATATAAKQSVGTSSPVTTVSSAATPTDTTIPPPSTKTCDSKSIVEGELAGNEVSQAGGTSNRRSSSRMSRRVPPPPPSDRPTEDTQENHPSEFDTVNRRNSTQRRRMPPPPPSDKSNTSNDDNSQQTQEEESNAKKSASSSVPSFAAAAAAAAASKKQLQEDQSVSHTPPPVEVPVKSAGRRTSVIELEQKAGTLGAGERYMFAMLSLKGEVDLVGARRRLDCMIYKQQFEHNWSNCYLQMQLICKACEDIKNCNGLRKVLKVVLKVANQLNDGGEQAGFTIEALCQLQNSKTFDQKTTVLQYIVMLIGRNHPDALKFPEEVLPSVRKASRLIMETIEEEKVALQVGQQVHMPLIEAMGKKLQKEAEKLLQEQERIRTEKAARRMIKIERYRELLDRRQMLREDTSDFHCSGFLEADSESDEDLEEEDSADSDDEETDSDEESNGSEVTLLSQQDGNRETGSTLATITETDAVDEDDEELDDHVLEGKSDAEEMLSSNQLDEDTAATEDAKIDEELATNLEYQSLVACIEEVQGVISTEVIDVEERPSSTRSSTNSSTSADNGIEHEQQPQHASIESMSVYDFFASGCASSRCDELEQLFQITKMKYADIVSYFGEDSKMPCEELFTNLARFIQDFVNARDLIDRLKRAEQRRKLVITKKQTT